MQVQRRLEEERRQDDVEDQVVGQFEARIGSGCGERRAREHETNRVGQAEASRGQRDEKGEAEQSERPKYEDVHEARSRPGNCFLSCRESRRPATESGEAPDSSVQAAE